MVRALIDAHDSSGIEALRKRLRLDPHRLKRMRVQWLKNHRGLDCALQELPEDLRMLRDTIRRFMRDEVKPVEDTLPHDAYTPEPEALKALRWLAWARRRNSSARGGVTSSLALAVCLCRGGQTR